MEAILCTQCQSQNPQYTKFCLTCGATVTIPVKREKPAASAAAPTTSTNAGQQVSASEVKALKSEGTTNNESQNGGWLRGLKKLWIF